MNFKELAIRPDIERAIEDMGFEEMTPIQEAAIPVALSGQDVIGQAQTGTGKTAAFTIPFLERIDTSEDVVQVLVLTPTRELCIQVEKEVYRLSRYMRARSVAVYGGQEIVRQIRELKNRPHIIVATPGRLMDHLRRRTIRLEHVRMVVLDEADEMLNMGFLEDVETILKECPAAHQTMMFSATMRSEVERIANQYMKEPQLVRVAQSTLTVPAIEQSAYIVYEEKKLTLLLRLLEITNPPLAMIFGRTKRRVDELTRALQKLGFRADGIHGDLTQYQRDQVMRKFREGQIDVLVATDVAARGLDVSGVTHVFNFDLPQDADSYVHRIGRTGRAGHEGKAFSFATPREKGHLAYIERVIRTSIDQASIPTADDSKRLKQDALIKDILRRTKAETVQPYEQLAQRLVEACPPEAAVAVLLAMLHGDEDREQTARKIQLTAERPIFSKKMPHNNNKKGQPFKGKKPDQKKFDKNKKSKDGKGKFTRAAQAGMPGEKKQRRKSK